MYRGVANATAEEGGLKSLQEKESMLDWSDYYSGVKRSVGDLAAVVPNVAKGFNVLVRASEESVHLDAKTRELIALAVAVTTRCDGCIAKHVEAAIRNGTTRAEVAEALAVAIAMNAGAALVYSGRALDCFQGMKGNKE